MTHHYRVGDVLPWEPESDAPLTSAPLGEERWHVLVSRPRRESRLRDWLTERGVVAWYPQAERRRRKPSAPGGVVAYMAPLVSGYVLMRVEGEPIWPAIRACPDVARVVTHGEVPVVVSKSQMLRMEQLPGLLEMIRAEDEAREAARIEATRPVAGSAALVTDGVFGGRTVMVHEVRGNDAQVLLSALDLRVTIAVTRLRRMD